MLLCTEESLDEFFDEQAFYWNLQMQIYQLFSIQNVSCIRIGNPSIERTWFPLHLMKFKNLNLEFKSRNNLRWNSHIQIHIQLTWKWKREYRRISEREQDTDSRRKIAKTSAKYDVASWSRIINEKKQIHNLIAFE